MTTCDECGKAIRTDVEWYPYCSESCQDNAAARRDRPRVRGKWVSW